VKALEKRILDILSRDLREVELRLVKMECMLRSLDSKLLELKEDMRKILEGDRRRRWPL